MQSQILITKQMDESIFIQQQSQNGKTTAKNMFQKLEINIKDSFKDYSYEKLWKDVYTYPSNSNFFGFEINDLSFNTTDSEERDQNYHSIWKMDLGSAKNKFRFDAFDITKKLKQNTIQQNKDSSTLNLQKANQIQVPTFQIDCKPPKKFMGAFIQTQQNFGFNLNITTLSTSDYIPFSRILDYSKQILDQVNQPYNDINQSKQKLDSKDQIKKESNQYFFEISSVKSESMIEEFYESRIQGYEPQQNIQNNSLLWNYESLFKEHKQSRFKDPMWQQKQNLYEQMQWPRASEVYKDRNLETLLMLQKQLNIAEDLKGILSDEFIMNEISKMFQNIECSIFILEYTTLTWRLDLKNYRLEHSFRSSLSQQLSDILLLSNYRSRIQVALEYIRIRPFRRIYCQVGRRIQSILIIFEEIILENVKTNHLIQFLMLSKQLKLELTLVYNLLINSDIIKQHSLSYENFDYKFLNSQFMIFKQILKLARESDSLSSPTRQMVFKLLNSVFKPIICILNDLAFEQSNTIDLNRETYLNYYIQNSKDITKYLGKRIEIIKNQNNQLYLICKMKQTLEIISDLGQLQYYQHKWDILFQRKTKLIEKVRKNHRRKIKNQRQKKEQERIKEIYQMRMKLNLINEQESQKKRQIFLKNKKELEDLKKEIQIREQRRKLNEQLQKQRQRKYLLDLELRQKRNLLNEKNNLLKKIQGSPIQLKQEIGEELQIEAKQLQIESKQMIEEQKNQSNDRKIGQSYEAKETNTVKLMKQKSKGSFQIQTQKDKLRQSNQKQKQQKSKLSQKKPYFALLQNQKKYQYIQSDQSSNQSLSDDQFQGTVDQLQIKKDVDTSTCLDICINSVIKRQIQIVELSIKFLVLEKYSIVSLLNFMKERFMAGRGQIIQEFIRLSINQEAILNLKHFNDCLLFDQSDDMIKKFLPVFYSHQSGQRLSSNVNIIQDNLQYYIGLQFKKLPFILEPYFSYIHLSKYMQIFSFIIKIKFCSNMASEAWKTMNNYNKQIMKSTTKTFQKRLLQKMYGIRFIIQNYLTTFQNYLFFRVIEKQFRIMKIRLNQFKDFEVHHIKMLDNIIKLGFIDSSESVSKNIKRILALIVDFKNIADLLCVDDLPRYRWQEVEKRILYINLTLRKEIKIMDGLLFRS